MLAYLFRGGATGWLSSHYTYLIRTFWLGLLYGMISILAMIILIGWLMWIAILVWLVVRCVKSMQKLSRREAMPDPQTWMA